MQIAHRRSAPLERKQRLSRSLLWKLQRNYFERQGIAAWSTGAVPHHITSNAFIADTYARVVFGFLRDCHAAANPDDASTFAPLDLSQPIYVVELGSGPGRFAYLFLKKLLNIQSRSVLKDIPVKYVMTDFAEQNIEHWRNHPWLQPFVESGSLDFARFDVERDEELRLAHSGDTLSPLTVRNPLVLISNYVFDSIPQDAFYVAQGQLYETLVTLNTPQKEADPNDPEILSRVEISYHNKLVEGDYYDDPEWNRMLQDYRERLPGAAILFPLTALRCLQSFQRLSSGRMLVLSGDRGYNGDEALVRGQGAPVINIHGSFSMMIDYHLIGEYCVRHEGQALHPAHGHESLNISAFIFGKQPDGFIETRQAYAEAVEKFGPDDFFSLRGGLEDAYETLTLQQILAFLRLSCWDYNVFWACLPVIKSHLAAASELDKQALSEAIRQIWDAYLPIGEEEDLAFELGTLLLEMEFYTEALEFLQYSVSLYRMEPGTAYNLGVCYQGLRQIEKAHECINQALELDPEFDAAKAMRIRLQSAMSHPAAKRL